MKTYSKMTKRVVSALTLSCCILFTGNVQAETYCSYGDYNCNVRNMNEQAAVKAEQERIDAENASRAAGASSSVDSTPVYTPPRASQFGAVAWDMRRSIWGYSVLQPTQRAANLAAIADCGTRNCKVMDKFANTCIAMAWGGGRTQTESDVNQSVAEQKALSGCNAKGQNCSIILSECSLP